MYLWSVGVAEKLQWIGTRCKRRVQKDKEGGRQGNRGIENVRDDAFGHAVLLHESLRDKRQTARQERVNTTCTSRYDTLSMKRMQDRDNTRQKQGKNGKNEAK
jgi:hypothetical protein